MKCPVCGNQVRLNKDGSFAAHYKDDDNWWRVLCAASCKVFNSESINKSHVSQLKRDNKYQEHHVMSDIKQKGKDDDRTE